MSFNYGQMGNNPMHHPMMHMTNGTNFMSPLAPAAIPGLSGPASLLPQMAGLNDNPLEFNMKKNQPPGAGPMDLETANEMFNDRDREMRLIMSENRRKMVEQGRDRERSVDRKSDLDSSGSSVEGGEKSNIRLTSNEMLFNGILGTHHGLMMMLPGMMNMMDPASLMQMQQFPMLNQLNAVQSPTVAPQTQSTTADGLPQKEVINCSSCTLFPPNPVAPPPTTRERPPGCRTVFVGGLPENITEDIIREVFDRCGEITTLRLSKKNFCHIRFAYETSVDSAIYLSGYRIRIGNSTDNPNCGRLHVDYAQARDDQYEWECRQRQLQREQRHRERMEQDRLRPMSPPPIVHYTDHEASSVSEKLKMDESFGKAVQVLITWLERGDCSKKNSNTFYSMIQSTNSHVRRLLNEKGVFEEELIKAKENYRKQMQMMVIQFTQIEKVFNAASHKKVWDHFTKAQRKNIDMWKKQSMEIRTVQFEDVHDDDEMEMSDDEKDVQKFVNKRAKFDNENLKDENDSLRCQLEAYKNEVDLVKSDLKSESDMTDQQIKVLHETIRNLQTQLLEKTTRERENTNKILDLESKLKAANVKELLLKTKIVTATKNSNASSNRGSETEDETPSNTQTTATDDNSTSLEQHIVNNPSNTTVNSTQHHHLHHHHNNNELPAFNVSQKINLEEAKLIGLVTTFLMVHPFGASIDYILSYVQRVNPKLRPKSLEEILLKYGDLFQEQVTGVGAKIERKWTFCGFDTKTTLND